MHFSNEFEERGLTQVSENGDILVGLFIHSEQKQATSGGYDSAYNYGYGYGYGGYYGYGPGYGWGYGVAPTTYNYNEGTLVCDVYDTQEKKLIWEGTGQNMINDNPEERAKTIPIDVAKIMANYPVPPVSSK